MREYGTGSRRDSREGKGRYDLISPYALERLAKRLEYGVKKYGERNWEKGQPQQDFYDSAMRHMNKWQMGFIDEDHLAAAMWNIHCMIHFDEEELHTPAVLEQMFHRIDDFICLGCGNHVDLVNSDYLCSDCIEEKDDEILNGRPGEVIKPMPAVFDPPQSHSKGLAESGKVIPYPEAKDALGGHTDPLESMPVIIEPNSKQPYPTHTRNQNAEMLRREDYRNAYRHSVYGDGRDTKTMEQLTIYD